MSWFGISFSHACDSVKEQKIGGGVSTANLQNPDRGRLRLALFAGSVKARGQLRPAKPESTFGRSLKTSKTWMGIIATKPDISARASLKI